MIRYCVLPILRDVLGIRLAPFDRDLTWSSSVSLEEVATSAMAAFQKGMRGYLVSRESGAVKKGLEKACMPSEKAMDRTSA